MIEAPRPFVPAAGRDWLLPLYDPLARLMGADRIRVALVGEADPQPGDRVLDLGCGTGSLAIRLRQLRPETLVVGLDPDPKALARARRKAERAGLEVDWQQGFADALPFPDCSFDGVVSSLVFHHLPPEGVRGAVTEIHRILRPGGSVHVLDFGTASNGVHGLLAHLIPHQRGDDEVASELPALMEEAGLVEVGVHTAGRVILGKLFVTVGEVPKQAA